MVTAEHPDPTVGGELAWGVRMPSLVGDAVAALPSVQLMMRAVGTVHVLGPGFAKKLMPRGVDYTVVTRRRHERTTLKGLGINRYLILKPSFGAAWAGRGAGRKTAGYAGHHRKWLLSLHLPMENGVLKAEALLRLAEAALDHWGVPVPDCLGERRKPKLEVEPDELEHARARVEQEEGLTAGRFLVCCPLAAAREDRPQWKRWPGFEQLSEALDAAGVAHVACPAPGESRQCATRLPRAQLVEETSLHEYAAVIAISAGVIANDSGPMHLAGAVGVPTVALFGDTDPVAYGGGPNPNVRVLGQLGAWPSLEEVWQAVAGLTEGFAPLPDFPATSASGMTP